MSQYFIAKNVANMLTKPDPNSALDSQAIAGTIVTIEKEENGYCYVHTPDLYKGWVNQLRLSPVWDRSSYETIYVISLFADVYEKPHAEAALITKLVLNTRLAKTKNNVEPFVEILLPDKTIAYVHKNCVAAWAGSSADNLALAEKWRVSATKERKEIIKQLGGEIANTAKRFVGTPYLWGGCTPFGIDCSGLTQIAYNLNGIPLLRNSYMQFDDKRFKKIEKDKPLDKAVLEAGDILVFDIKQKGKVDHIGIAGGDGTFIQTRGEMKDGGFVIDSCDDDYYKSIYIGAARFNAEADLEIKSAVAG